MSPRTPKPTTNPTKPQRWPNKARGVAEDSIARMGVIEGHADGLERALVAIDALAQRGIDAVREGNWRLAEQLLNDIRHDTASERHRCVRIKMRAGTTRVALAGALVGEYGKEG